MDILISTLVILFTTNLAMVFQKAYFHKISVNYVALFFGMILGLVPLLNNLVEDFQSEVFMELIVAPLLFFEGQNTQLLLC
ncbi:hypothetical protein N581_10010 [Lactobacillus jensenii MD IIE-70(2)]|nr:hypothetical protein N581_10010 [Lactobacillus jensenii MD IIE-70(2)]